MLLLTDTIDEWLIGHLGEFDGREFRDVKRGELALDGEDEAEAGRAEADAEHHAALLERLKQQLGAAGRRTCGPPTGSANRAACLVLGEHEMGAQMRKLMQATGQAVPEAKPILEMNPAHPLLVRLAGETDEARVCGSGPALVDQAHLAEGGQLEDPGGVRAATEPASAGLRPANLQDEHGPPPREALTLDGPAGRIEALLDTPAGPLARPSPWSVIPTPSTRAPCSTRSCIPSAGR